MALPAAAAFTGSSITEGQFKTAITDLRDYIANMETVPAGAISAFAMSTPPTGWVKANGAAISRTTYAALFARIGTYYGAGDGATTFNLPDLRGLFLRAWDDGRGMDPARGFGSFQDTTNLWHGHTTDSQGVHTHLEKGAVYNTSSGYSGTDAGDVFGNVQTGAAGAHAHNVYGDGASESRPRNIAILFCIKY